MLGKSRHYISTISDNQNIKCGCTYKVHVSYSSIRTYLNSLLGIFHVCFHVFSWKCKNHLIFWYSILNYCLNNVFGCKIPKEHSLNLLLVFNCGQLILTEFERIPASKYLCLCILIHGPFNLLLLLDHLLIAVIIIELALEFLPKDF